MRMCGFSGVGKINTWFLLKQVCDSVELIQIIVDYAGTETPQLFSYVW